MGSSNTADDLNLLAINLSWKSSETKSSKLTFSFWASDRWGMIYIYYYWRALTKEHIKYDAKQYEKGITGAAAKHTAARQGGMMRQSETGRQSKQVCLQRQRTCSAGTAIMVNN